jgi:hypothetical protein
MTGLNHYGVLIGKVDLNFQPAGLGKATGYLLGDILLICAAAVALLLVLVLWAKYLRNLKPKKRRSGGQKVVRDSALAEPEEDESEEAQELRRRYKFRYKRREHRARNPTLAETGGLPPARSQEPTKPS